MALPPVLLLVVTTIWIGYLQVRQSLDILIAVFDIVHTEAGRKARGGELRAMYVEGEKNKIFLPSSPPPRLETVTTDTYVCGSAPRPHLP